MANEESCDALISEDILLQLFTKLPDDDRERIKLLFGKSVSQIGDGRHNPAYRHRELWIEILFTIQRFDLLRTILGSCKFQAQQQLHKCTYIPGIRKLLINIFEKIVENSDSEVDLRSKYFQHQQSLTLGDWLLRKSAESKDENCSKILAAIFKELGWKDLEDETLAYQVAYPNGEVVVEPFKLAPDDTVNFYPMNKPFENFGRAFEAFGFSKEIHNDLTLAQLNSTIQRLADRDHGKFSAFVCCIMSHGSKGTFLTSDSKDKRIDEVVAKICGCETLKGKPKLFFIQACQGKNVQAAISGQIETRLASSDNHGSSTNATDTNVVSNEQDVLLSFATVQGCRAFREKKGSLYVRALIKALNARHDFVDMVDIHYEISKNVGENAVTYRNGSNVSLPVSQTSTYQSTLKRRLRLVRQPKQ